MALTADFLVSVRAQAAPATANPVHPASGLGFATVLQHVNAAPVLPFAVRTKPGEPMRVLPPVAQTGPLTQTGSAAQGIALSAEPASGSAMDAASPGTKDGGARLTRPQPAIIANAGSPRSIQDLTIQDLAAQDLATRDLADPQGQVPQPVQKKAGAHPLPGLDGPATHHNAMPANTALATLAPAMAPTVVPAPAPARNVPTDHPPVPGKDAHEAASPAVPSAVVASQLAPLTPAQQSPLAAAAAAHGLDASPASAPVSGGTASPQPAASVASRAGAFQQAGHTPTRWLEPGAQAAPALARGTEQKAAAAASGASQVTAPQRNAAPAAGDALRQTDIFQPGAAAPLAAPAAHVPSAAPIGPAAADTAPALPDRPVVETVISSPLQRTAEPAAAESPSAALAAQGTTLNPASGAAQPQPTRTPDQPAAPPPHAAGPGQKISVPVDGPLPGLSNDPVQAAYQPLTAPAGQGGVAADLAAQPAGPGGPAGAVQGVAAAQASAASNPAQIGAPAGSLTRTAMRSAAASAQGMPTGFDTALNGDGIAPTTRAPGPAEPAPTASRPASSSAAQAQPAQAPTQPASQHVAGPAETGMTPKADASPAPGRPGKPASPGLAEVAAKAAAPGGATDPGAPAATASVQLQPQAAGTSTGPAQPAAGNTGAAAAQNAAPTATPAAQLAQAVTSLHVGADGSSHVTIKLDPIELGQLQIRISRAADGTASVNVAVERPQTLASLQGDLGHLHEALDRAGLPEQRSVSLHLAVPDQAGSQNLGAGAGNMSQGGFQQGARQERQPSSSFVPDSAGSLQSVPAASEAATPYRQTQKSGVNITA